MLKIYNGVSELIPARLISKMQADNSAHGDNAEYRITPRDQNLIRDLRYVMRENQTQFWSRFGVTQTQGSRYERGKAIPLPALLLIRLYLLHLVSDADLQQVRSPDFDNQAPD